MLVRPPEYTLDGIKQYFVAVEKEDYKLATLYDLFDCLTVTQAVIYVNTRRKAKWLANKLMENDWTCGYIHGALLEQEKDSRLREFRMGSIRYLILTDDAYDGSERMNFNFVSLKVNYDLPLNKECYIHRNGRYGHYGRRGIVVNFVPDDEEAKLKEIEQFYNTSVDELPMDIDSIF